MTKVLWLGDAGCHTGFARVTHSLGERLVTQYDHDVHVLAFNHRGDYWETPLKLYVPTLRKADDLYGRSRIIEILDQVKPEVVVILHDAHLILSVLFNNPYDPARELLQARPIITYTPVDGYNRPPVWSELLSKTTKVVAMSRFGQAAYEGSSLVYHGVDPESFWPVRERPIVVSPGVKLRTKRECKRALGFDPKGFLVLRVDKNSGRKDFAATWKALLPAMRRHKDIQVHFHTTASEAQSGVDLRAMMSREPDVDRSRFFLPDFHNSFVGWPTQMLNALYNAADLFVTTSRGEGFGLTIAEALMCGVPVIAQNVTSIPEVVGPGGVLLEPQRLITVPSGEDVWLADIEAFTEAIETLYESAGRRRTLGEAGRDHVLKSFSWDFAAARFDEYIRALASVPARTEAPEATSGPD